MVSRNSTPVLHAGVAALISLALSGLSFASTVVTPNVSTVRSREATAQTFVGQALKVWQERLNLKDWQIRVELVHPSALEPKTLGNIHWNTDTKEATINVLSSRDYTLPLPEMLSDMEFTVVHELIHLHLASLPRSNATEVKEEFVVNQLAHALLNLSKH